MPTLTNGDLLFHLFLVMVGIFAFGVLVTCAALTLINFIGDVIDNARSKKESRHG